MEQSDSGHTFFEKIYLTTKKKTAIDKAYKIADEISDDYEYFEDNNNSKLYKLCKDDNGDVYNGELIYNKDGSYYFRHEETFQKRNHDIYIEEIDVDFEKDDVFYEYSASTDFE